MAFDKIGSLTTTAIAKQRRKQEPAVMAELDQRLRRLNSLKMDQNWNCVNFSSFERGYKLYKLKNVKIKMYIFSPVVFYGTIL